MDESLRLPPRLAAILEDLPLEELAFTPVPVRPRRDGRTPARQPAADRGSEPAAARGDHDADPAGTLRRLLDEIDPAGAERPRKTNDFPPRFA